MRPVLPSWNPLGIVSLVWRMVRALQYHIWTDLHDEHLLPTLEGDHSLSHRPDVSHTSGKRLEYMVSPLQSTDGLICIQRHYEVIAVFPALREKELVPLVEQLEAAISEADDHRVSEYAHKTSRGQTVVPTSPTT